MTVTLVLGGAACVQDATLNNDDDKVLLARQVALSRYAIPSEDVVAAPSANNVLEHGLHFIERGLSGQPDRPWIPNDGWHTFLLCDAPGSDAVEPRGGLYRENCIVPVYDLGGSAAIIRPMQRSPGETLASVRTGMFERLSPADVLQALQNQQMRNAWNSRIRTSGAAAAVGLLVGTVAGGVFVVKFAMGGWVAVTAFAVGATTGAVSGGLAALFLHPGNVVDLLDRSGNALLNRIPLLNLPSAIDASSPKAAAIVAAFEDDSVPMRVNRVTSVELVLETIVSLLNATQSRSIFAISDEARQFFNSRRPFLDRAPFGF